MYKVKYDNNNNKKSSGTQYHFLEAMGRRRLPEQPGAGLPGNALCTRVLQWETAKKLGNPPKSWLLWHPEHWEGEAAAWPRAPTEAFPALHAQTLRFGGGGEFASEAQDVALKK